MSETNVQKFKRLLSELFMFDHADLDFGIYRIMNAKRDEIRRFLDDDLLPQVRKEIEHLDTGKREQLLREREETLQQLHGLLVAEPENNPKIREIDAQLGQSVDVTALENEIFSDLYDFFRRYYSEGDYLALRRYKEGVYAIPYEGEEVKLHWANADQYYIKTSEYFRDYTFKLPDHRRVHFKLTSADTEQNNNKSTNGEKRVFILCADDFIEEENGELVICFEYRVDPQKRKQEELNQEAAQRILSVPNLPSWIMILGRPAPTDSNPDRTFLKKYLADYTSRNTFDYFIHKDLGAFLRRELDFFIKNEIMHLDDIEHESAPRVEVYLSKIKALRRVAKKIIDFLEQLENFQKKLWLKKKFVIETNYCVTLDRVPEELYPEIAANDAQREEWVHLFAIDEISESDTSPSYSIPLSIQFLKANINLPVDTRFFDDNFTIRLLSSIENFDTQLDGVLIHSDNFQAMQLLRTRYQQQVKCIYIDPPYNTASSSIPYKNDYKHSSWASLMQNRLAMLQPVLSMDGAIFVSIDKTERTVLQHVMDAVFGANNRIEELIWSMNTTNSQLPNYSTNHEYILVYAQDKRIAEQDSEMFREPKPGFSEVMDLIAGLNPSYPTISEIEVEIKKLYNDHKIEYRDEIEAQGLDWNEEGSNDPWRGLYNYNHAEYRDENGVFVREEEASEKQATIWVWQEGDASMPATKQAASTQDPNSPNWRFYKPIHPVTGKPCPHPKSGWKFAYENDEDSPDRRSFMSLDRDHRIAWGADEKKVPRLKRMLHEVETNIGKSVFQDYSDGEKQTSAMFGKSGLFLAPKHANFVSRFIVHAAKQNSIIVDCFGGSGSTAHAVIKLNREDRGKRKYILVEMGEYFDTLLKPRVLKAGYSNDWRNGKPISRWGISQCIKVLRLESYEDALNNLRLHSTPTQQKLLWDEGKNEFREDYVLHYMLDVEAKGSTTLLDLKQFVNPFAYQLEIGTGTVGETRPMTIDLIETFNYLLGLHVRRIQAFDHIRVVEGENRDGQQILIIWRNQEEVDNAKLDAFFRENGGYEANFDLIYVNGDNNLENLKQGNEIWQVLLIEEAFHQLMFDTQDV